MYATTAPDAYALYLGASLSASLPASRLRYYVDAGLCHAADSPGMSTFIAGGIGGAVSRTVTAPLDRLKILAQEGRVLQFTMPHPTLQKPARGLCDSELMVSLYRYVVAYEGGIRGFWRGNGVNCLKAGPEFATAFAARQFYSDCLCRDPAGPTFLQNATVGAAGGATAQLIWYPLEVTKQRMAASKHGEYGSIADCVGQSLARGGVRDLYTGCCANMVGIIPHRGLEMGLFFTLQQSAKRRYGADGVPVWMTTGIGFVASLFAQLVTYPLNLARTKLQTQGVNGRPRLYHNLGHCLRTICMESGPRGLFVGILPNMLKAVPASSVMFVTFNETQNFINRHKRSS